MTRMAAIRSRNDILGQARKIAVMDGAPILIKASAAGNRWRAESSVIEKVSGGMVTVSSEMFSMRYGMAAAVFNSPNAFTRPMRSRPVDVGGK